MSRSLMTVARFTLNIYVRSVNSSATTAAATVKLLAQELWRTEQEQTFKIVYISNFVLRRIDFVHCTEVTV